jgi:HTH-type transcriptional regulator, quorum sensing regulator NprR
MNTMEFLTTGEKLKKLRKQLGLKQHELEEANITRSFISMVESDKKSLSKDTSKAIADLFKRKASEKGIEFNISGDYLTCSPKEEAEKYCHEKLKDESCQYSLEAIDEIIKISKTYNLKELLEKAYLLKGDSLYAIREYVEAFTCYTEILEMHLNTAREDKLAFILNKLAKCKIQLMQYAEALSCLNKAYTYVTLHEDETIMKYVLYNFALCYRLVEEYDKSLVYAQRLIALCSIETEFDVYISTIIIMYNCYLSKGDIDKAVQSYNEAISKFTDETHPLLGYIYNNLGISYTELNELEKAMSYLERSKSIRMLYDKSKLPYTLISIANLHVIQNDFEKALELTNEVIALNEFSNDNTLLLQAYEVFEGIYSIQKDYLKLENVYKCMLEILKGSNDKNRLSKIGIKLSLLYINTNNIIKAKECLESTLNNDN